jgi:hypothetical protein
MDVPGLMSIWLSRNAYDAGTLAATQPGITLIDPVTSTALGCWLSATASIVAGSWPRLSCRSP